MAGSKITLLQEDLIIRYFASAMLQHSSIEEVLWDITKNCIAHLQFEDCVIYLVDEYRRVLVQKAAYGDKSPEHYSIVNPIEIPLGKGIVGSVAVSGKPEIIADTTKDPRYIIDDESRLSEITVPIFCDGKVVGIIDSEHSEKDFYTQKHLEILTAIASLCGVKIARIKADEEVRKRDLQLSESKRKLAEMKFSVLTTQMNPHFIFNCLSSIRSLMNLQEIELADKYLTDFANLFRHILDFSERDFISLEKELEVLRLYLELEAMRFDNDLRFEIVAPQADQLQVMVPPLIFQPVVENAIQHGLAPKEANRQLTVKVAYKDNMLECVIEDNGIGRDQAAVIRSKNPIKSRYAGKGLAILKDRLRYLHGADSKTEILTIVDRFDKKGQAEGTTIKMLLPVITHA